MFGGSEHFWLEVICHFFQQSPLSEENTFISFCSWSQSVRKQGTEGNLCCHLVHREWLKLDMWWESDFGAYIFLKKNQYDEKFKCPHLNSSLHLNCNMEVAGQESVSCHSLCSSASWNIQVPYIINMHLHTSLRTLRFWEYLELFSHSNLIPTDSLNGFKTYTKIVNFLKLTYCICTWTYCMCGKCEVEKTGKFPML